MQEPKIELKEWKLGAFIEFAGTLIPQENEAVAYGRQEAPTSATKALGRITELKLPLWAQCNY